tara:strand:- start:727 stop:1242 length:516 start_codon:yes stop_codon:yes gene_type:complete
MASFSVLGTQAILGDPIGVEMQSFDKGSGMLIGDTMTNAINSMSDSFTGCYDSSSNLIGGYNNQTYTTEIECTYANQFWIEGTGASYSELSYQTAQMQLTMANEISVTNNPVTSAATQVFQLFQIITGTYAFNLLVFFGIPEIFVAGISMIYVITLSIWTILLLRGNNVNA